MKSLDAEPGDSAAPSGRRSALDRVETLAGFVRQAKGWRRAGIGCLAGAISVLALAPFFVWPVLFLTFPVLVWLVDGPDEQTRPVVDAAIGTWWFAFGYFFVGLIWIGEAFLVEAEIFAWLMPFAVTLLPAFLALFWAAPAAVARAFWQPGPARLLVFAVSLSIGEWLRGHILTGFPWNVPGYALTYPLALMQSADVLGIYGLTLWAIPIFAGPLVVALDRSPGTSPRVNGRLGVAIAAVPLACAFLYGTIRLAQPPTPFLDGVKLRIVQPSIPQRDKWVGAKQPAIFADHLDLSRRDPTGKPDDLAGITHVIWPEAAMPFRPLDHPEALSAIDQLLGAQTFLLAGALRVVADDSSPPPPRGRAYNSLMVFAPGGVLHGLYDKIHLVPGGEYLPFQPLLEAVGLQSLTRQRGGFSTGAVPRPLLTVPGLPAVTVLICYEAIFPDEVVQGPERPGLILVVTNDGWFGHSIGPYQHFHQSRVRAVEQGVTVIRAANNGISAVVDPFGRVLATLALDVRGGIDSPLPAARPLTLYARFGDLFFLIQALAFAAVGRLAMGRDGRK